MSGHSIGDDDRRLALIVGKVGVGAAVGLGPGAHFAGEIAHIENEGSDKGDHPALDQGNAAQVAPGVVTVFGNDTRRTGHLRNAGRAQVKRPLTRSVFA